MKVLIVGGGQVGAYIAQTLIRSNFDVKVIENRPHIVEKLKFDIPQSAIFEGEGTNNDVLEQCGIATADILVAVTGADETNLVITTLAKFEYGVPKVIARVNNPKNEWLFNAGMGVDLHLNQANLMSKMIIESMDVSDMLTLMPLYNSAYSIVQLKVLHSSPVHGKAIKDIKLPSESLLIAITRDEKVILPKGDQIILSDDEILAIVCEDSRLAFTKLFQV